MRMQIKHVDAIIELLSAADDEVLAWLGLDAMNRAALGEVFDGALAAYEENVGYAHPLAAPTDEHDDELEGLPLFIHEAGNA